MSDTLTLSDVKQLTKHLFGQANVITFPRILLNLTGDHVAAIFLNQILYWSERTTDQDDWFYKTDAEWADELGMTYFQVCRCVEQLQNIGVQTSLRRADGAPRTHYRIDQKVFAKAFKRFLKNQETRNSRKSKIEKVKTRNSSNSKNNFRLSQKSLKEAEITTEITAENTHTQKKAQASPSRARVKKNQAANPSRHSLKTCTAYATTRPGIANPGGYGTSIFRTGEADEMIDDWLEKQKLENIESFGVAKVDYDSELTSNFLASAKPKLNEKTFATWFQPLQGLKLEEKRIVIYAPGGMFEQTLRSNYADVLEEVRDELSLSDHEIVFVEAKGVVQTNAATVRTANCV